MHESCYQIKIYFSVSPIFHFVKESSLKRMGVKLDRQSAAATTVGQCPNWLMAVTTRLELCKIRKTDNRLVYVVIFIVRCRYPKSQIKRMSTLRYQLISLFQLQFKGWNEILSGGSRTTADRLVECSTSCWRVVETLFIVIVRIGNLRVKLLVTMPFLRCWELFFFSVVHDVKHAFDT